MDRSKMTYEKRTELLRKSKQRDSTEKFKKLEPLRESDTITPGVPSVILRDKGLIPVDFEISYEPVSNHPSGGVFGPEAVGKNFRRFLEAHPAYIDPINTLAGGYHFYFLDLQPHSWNPEIFYAHLLKEHKMYGLIHGIEGGQHMCPDIRIGLQLGWGGILEKVRSYENKCSPDKKGFYKGLEEVALGIIDFIDKHSSLALEMFEDEVSLELKEDLLRMAEATKKIARKPPETFYEAIQFCAFYAIFQAMYNASSAMGRIDDFLLPYYNKDIAKGILTDEEAIFHIECLLMKDDSYYDVGAMNEDGEDITNPLSYLVLEAQSRLNIPSHVSVSIHDNQDPKLLKTAMKYLLEDKNGQPNIMGQSKLVEGFIRNGYSIEDARKREKSGCHWFGIPGREYTLNDVIRINLPKIFETSLYDMASDISIPYSLARLETIFYDHLEKAIEVTAKGIDINVRHKQDIFPELVLDFFCYGTIEKGRDLTNGVLEYNNFGVDAAGIGTVSDSFAAIKERVEIERSLSWNELFYYLDKNWSPSEYYRLLMKNIPKFGTGGSIADDYGKKIAQRYTELVIRNKTPDGHKMIPGLFSWLDTIPMGKNVGPLPNGRRDGEPLSFSTLPESGLTAPSSLTQRVVASAMVQSDYGNPSPIHLEIEPIYDVNDDMVDKMCDFVKGAFQLGNTELNITFADKEKILDAHKHPDQHLDLIVRVTGFSAYFVALSKEARQLIVDRLLNA